MIKDHPLGVRGRFQEEFLKYISPSLESQVIVNGTFVNNPHSELLWWGVDFGWAGIIFYLYLWIVWAISLFKNYSDPKKFAISLGVATALIQSLVDFNLHTAGGIIGFFPLFFFIETPIKKMELFKIPRWIVVTILLFYSIISFIRSMGEYHFRVADFYYKEKNLPFAVKEVSTSTSWWKYSWRAYSLKGIILKKDGMYEAAKKEFQKALKINPNDNFSLRHLGAIYAREGKYSKTVGLYLRALRLSPFWRYEIFKRLLPVLRMKGEYGTIEKILKKYPSLLEKEPQLRYYFKNLKK